jgi:pyruvate/2-oxoglutarate dehydrogenase complex dihydrolipoamide dehydrogenase (E3) component
MAARGCLARHSSPSGCGPPEHRRATSTQNHLVAYTIFIDLQLGRVGLSETEAQRQGRRVRVAKLPMSAIPRAIETGETRGFMKAIVDAET